jgi:hypothetical protein
VSGFKLADYGQRFGEICREKFGREYNLKALETEYAHLGRGERHLAARDIQKLFDPRLTPYGRYWTEPNREELDRKLKAARFSFAGRSDEDLVAELLRVLHNIGVVSLLLRFSRPARFAIFSTPVVYLIGVQSSRTVDLYLAYCNELAAWRDHFRPTGTPAFRIDSVAATELALWCYHQVTSRLETPDAARAIEAFEGDVWVQRRRAELAMSPLLKRSRLEIARILAHVDAKIAGMIAGEEYERLLRLAGRRFYPKHDLTGKEWARWLLDRMAQDHRLRPEDPAELHYAWKVRNQAVHPGSTLQPEEVERMVDAVERICRGWDVERAEAAGK